MNVCLSFVQKFWSKEEVGKKEFQLPMESGDASNEEAAPCDTKRMNLMVEVDFHACCHGN